MLNRGDQGAYDRRHYDRSRTVRPGGREPKERRNSDGKCRANSDQSRGYRIGPELASTAGVRDKLIMIKLNFSFKQVLMSLGDRSSIFRSDKGTGNFHAVSGHVAGGDDRDSYVSHHARAGAGLASLTAVSHPSPSHAAAWAPPSPARGEGLWDDCPKQNGPAVRPGRLCDEKTE